MAHTNRRLGHGECDGWVTSGSVGCFEGEREYTAACAMGWQRSVARAGDEVMWGLTPPRFHHAALRDAATIEYSTFTFVGARQVRDGEIEHLRPHTITTHPRQDAHSITTNPSRLLAVSEQMVSQSNATLP